MSSDAPPAPRDDGPGSYRMPFGVHKDKRLRDLPVSYVEWLLGLDGLRDPLRENLHALVRGLYDLAGGESVDALFTSAPTAGAADVPARTARGN
jgi:hypothetical protein